jgi:hypothetical protein
MLPARIPRDATLTHFEFPRSAVLSPSDWPDETREANGWILESKNDAYRVLDVFGGELVLGKTATRTSGRTVEEQLAADRKTPHFGFPDPLGDAWFSGRVGNPITILLLAHHALDQGDPATAARVLGPRTTPQTGSISFATLVRDQLAYSLDSQMEGAFLSRDYPRAIALGEVLSKSAFNGFERQAQAHRLASQLKARQDDFKSLRLPTPDEWTKLRSAQSRPESIHYLASRLRLLNCSERAGWPGDGSYCKAQWGAWHADAWHGEGDVINPMTELRALKIQPAELTALTPFLTDEDYMPTVWRDWDHGMMPDVLHRVSAAVAALVNEIAGQNLCDPQKFVDLTEEDKRVVAERVTVWARKNAGKPHVQLLMETLKGTHSWEEFEKTARELVSSKAPEALPVLVARRDDFPTQRFIPGFFDGSTSGEIARFVHDYETDATLPIARQWARDADPLIRFWAALILVERGDREDGEGMAELRSVLKEDRDLMIFAGAIDPLLASGKPEARALAESVLDAPQFGQRGWWGQSNGVLQHLFRAGSDRTKDYILRELDDETGTGGSTQGIHQSQPVGRLIEKRDEMGVMIASWTSGAIRYDRAADTETRHAVRERLKAWIEEQFAAIKAGHPAMPDGGSIGTAHFVIRDWQLLHPPR